MRSIAVVSRRRLAGCVMGLLVVLASHAHISTTAPLTAQQEKPLITRVAVGESFVGGRILSGRPVTITLRTEAGEQKGYGWGYPADDGKFEIPLRSDPLNRESSVVIESGDTIYIEEFIGDPTIVQVPTLTAQYVDKEAVVQGVTTPGVQVDVIMTVPKGDVLASAQASPSGQYRISLPQEELGAHPAGWLRTTDTNGNEFFVAWSAVSVDVGIGDNYVSILGPRRAQLQVQLAGSDSSALGANQQQTPPAKAFDTLQPTLGNLVFFRDIFGDAIPIVAGDTLSISRNGGIVDEIQTFSLTATLSVQNQTISVESIPGVQIVASISDGATRRQWKHQVTTEDDGSAVIAVGGADGPLSYKAGGTVFAVVGRVRMVRHVSAGGVELDLDSGEVVGRWRPKSAVRAQLLRDDDTVADVATQAGSTGDYRFSLVAATPSLQPGDILSVSLTSSQVGEQFAVTIPAFEVFVDDESNIIHGFAPAHSVLQLDVGSMFPDTLPKSHVPAVLVDETEQFRVEGDERLGLDPGAVVRAGLILPSGHVLRRAAAISQVAIQHGGSLYCGRTQPDAEVLAQVLRDDAVIATSSSRADELGKFRGEFFTGHRRLVVSSGDQVIMTFSGVNDTEIQFQLPELSVDIDWNVGRLKLQGEAHRTYQIVGRPSTCYDGPVAGVYSSGIYVRRVDEVGELDVVDPFFIRPTWNAVEVARRDVGGDVRVFTVVANPGVEVARATKRVGGVATPGFDIIGSTKGHSGNAGSQFIVSPNSEGQFSVQVPAEDWLLDSSGGEVALQWGATGDETVVSVGRTEFDFDRDGIIGTTDYGERVLLRLDLADGTRRETELAVDDEGNFRFSQDMLPVRSEWGFTSIRNPAIVVVTEAGHRVVTEVPEWAERDTTLYLPMVSNRP